MTAAAEHARSLLLAARAGERSEADRLAAALAAIDPAAIDRDEARIALWLNLYNALLLTELARHPRSGSLLRQRGVFRRTGYRVGEHEYSLDVIEHGVLRRNGRVPLRFARTLRRGDPRLAVMPTRLDPRIHFALNCGAVSCPPIRAYRAESLDVELEQTTTAYLRAETRVDRDRGRITLPYLMRLYRADFGDRSDRLDFAARHLPEHDADWLRSQRGVQIDYGRFDWTFAPRDTAPAMPQDNVAIVRRAFAFGVQGRGDPVEALADFDPDVVLTSVEVGPSHGRSAVRENLERWRSAWAESEATAEEFIDAGNRVIVSAYFRARGRESGVEVDARFYDVYTLRDGKIVRVDEFADRVEALEAAGLRE